MSFYRKYRPETIDDMQGNDAQLEAVRALFDKPTHPRAYLIHGPSGCGKTTLARIIAKTYLHADGFSLREINTAENRGIDTARDIIEQLGYATPTGSPNVYIIDECHKTTNEWQNAMLKPLEDTPNHTYFFLCTTEPDKLIKPLRTRLTDIALAALDEDALGKVIYRVIQAEGLEIPDSVQELIAETAGGSPRQALVSLEKVAGLESVEDMREALTASETEEAQLRDLCQALLNARSWKPVAEVLKAMKGSAEPESVRRGVLGYMSAVLLNSGNPRAGEILANFEDPTYNSGFPGLVLMAYSCFSAG